MNGSVVTHLCADEVQKWHTADPPKILGQGTYGRVLEAIDDCTGEIIAVKETTRSRAPKNKSIKALQKEMSTLRLLSHQNIVQYRGVQTATRTDGEDDTLLFLMEYCPNGSISDVLEDFGALGDDVTRRYTSQILCGLDYLHRLCIVHRDIKCANCLLSVGGVVKLADFGSSRHLADCGNSIQGTALYMAPEVIKGRRVGRQADVWAVGCCVVEMLGNSMPFEGRFSNDFALMYRISKVIIRLLSPHAFLSLPTSLAARLLLLVPLLPPPSPPSSQPLPSFRPLSHPIATSPRPVLLPAPASARCSARKRLHVLVFVRRRFGTCVLPCKQG
jgi:serine/threonine protein kinase